MKIAREHEPPLKQMKCGSRARAAKEVSCYVGMDLGDKHSNYCFIDAKGDIFAEGTLGTTQGELNELFSLLPKCRWIGQMRDPSRPGGGPPKPAVLDRPYNS
jgi:hypothetical protein